MSIRAAQKEYDNTRKLPIGHYDRENAKSALNKAIKKVYGACFAQEKKLGKNLPRLADFNIVWPLASYICDRLYINPPSNIFFGSPKMQSGSAGEYHPGDRSIHLTMSPYMIVFLHELTHHIAFREGLCDDHGENFLWIEKMVFECAAEFFNNHQ